MICIFQHIDANLDYEYILKSFLEKEHVDSEQEWVELYCEINGTPEECAYQILSKELTKYILIKEIDNDILDVVNKIQEKIIFLRVNLPLLCAGLWK